MASRNAVRRVCWSVGVVPELPLCGRRMRSGMPKCGGVGCAVARSAHVLPGRSCTAVACASPASAARVGRHKHALLGRRASRASARYRQPGPEPGKAGARLNCEALRLLPVTWLVRVMLSLRYGGGAGTARTSQRCLPGRLAAPRRPARRPPRGRTAGGARLRARLPPGAPR